MCTGLVVELRNAAGTVEVQDTLLASMQTHCCIRIRWALASNHLPAVVAEDLRRTLAESATRYSKIVACFSGKPVGLGLLTLLDLLHTNLGRLDIAIETSEDFAALIHYRMSIVNAKEGTRLNLGQRHVKLRQ